MNRSLATAILRTSGHRPFITGEVRTELAGLPQASRQFTNALPGRRLTLFGSRMRENPAQHQHYSGQVAGSALIMLFRQRHRESLTESLQAPNVPKAKGSALYRLDGMATAPVALGMAALGEITQ